MSQKWWYQIGLAGLVGLMGISLANAEGERSSICSLENSLQEQEAAITRIEAEDGQLTLVDISGDVVVSGTSTPVCALVLANGKNQFSCDGQGHYALDDVWLDSAGQITLYAWAEGFNPYKTVFTPTSASVNQRVSMTALQSCGGPYTLTVNSSGASGVQITSSTGHGGTTNYTKTGIASGTSVSLTAPQSPTSGKNFSSWSGCTTPSAGTNCTVSMTANKTVTANYTTTSGDKAKWGVINGECFTNGSPLTFSVTIDGVTKKSISRACSDDSTWEGWAETTAGTKNAAFDLQPGGPTGTFQPTLPANQCKLFVMVWENQQDVLKSGVIDCNTPLP